MPAEETTILYLDLGLRDPDGHCFCSRLNAKILIDDRTWQSWSKVGFEGSLTIRRSSIPGTSEFTVWTASTLNNPDGTSTASEPEPMRAPPPPAEPSLRPTGGPMKICPRCQLLMPEGGICSRCGFNDRLEGNYYRGAPAAQSAGGGVGALVLGLISVVFCCAWCITIPAGVIAIYLGNNARQNDPKGIANVGFILGIIGLSLGMLWLIALRLHLVHTYYYFNGGRILNR